MSSISHGIINHKITSGEGGTKSSAGGSNTWSTPRATSSICFGSDIDAPGARRWRWSLAILTTVSRNIWKWGSGSVEGATAGSEAEGGSCWCCGRGCVCGTSTCGVCGTDSCSYTHNTRTIRHRNNRFFNKKPSPTAAHGNARSHRRQRVRRKDMNDRVADILVHVYMSRAEATDAAARRWKM